MMEGCLNEALAEAARKIWPRQGYVQPALWIHRTTPDMRLSGHRTPFCLLFHSYAQTQSYAVLPEIDEGRIRNREGFNCELYIVPPAAGRLAPHLEKEFGYLALETDVGLSKPPTMTLLMHTSTDREAVTSERGWEDERVRGASRTAYSRGDCRKMSKDSFTHLPLDVFNALWEMNNGQECRK